MIERTGYGRLHVLFRGVMLLGVAALFSSERAAAQFQIRDLVFQSVKDSANTADVDLVTASPGIILLTGTNTNLALNRPVIVRYASTDSSKISSRNNPQLMVDGRVAGTSIFELLPGQEGTSFRIDLQATRIVNRVRTRAFPSSSTINKIWGYSIYIGMDTVFFTKVKQVPDNDVSVTDDFFDPDTARYILITIDQMDPNLVGPRSTLIAELEVYGVGYLLSGQFTCVPRNVGKPANWGRASWSGQLPAGTQISVQVRTGNSPIVDNSWSDWSDTIRVSNSLFTVFEPRQYMQYRAILETFSVDTPRLDEVIITYDTALVAQSALASLSPQETPILKEGLFQYQVQVQAGSQSTGVDTLIIGADLPIVVNSVSVGGTQVPVGVQYHAGEVAISFPSPINSNTTISAQLKFTPFQLTNKFPARIVSNANPSNPQTVDFTRNSAGLESWSITTTGVPEKILVDVTADPNPFTPNGDGRNDVTNLSFFVTNLLEDRPLRIKIYDVTGRIVRTLIDTKTRANGYVEGNAIRWDGRDDRGRLLPPGLYIYQVYVEVDGNEPAVVTKTVSLAY